MSDRGFLATLLSPVCGRGDREERTAGVGEPSTNETESVVVDPNETIDVETAPTVGDEPVFVASDARAAHPRSETSYAATAPADD